MIVRQFFATLYRSAAGVSFWKAGDTIALGRRTLRVIDTDWTRALTATPKFGVRGVRPGGGSDLRHPSGSAVTAQTVAAFSD